MPKQADNRLKCSFCGKSQDQVVKLIAGPSVYICNECVDLCQEILDEEVVQGASAMAGTNIPGTVPKFLSWDCTRLPQLQFAGLDATFRDNEPLASAEEKKLIDEAQTELDRLLKFYLDEQVQGAGAEPLFRTLLMLTARKMGRSSPELLPLLKELADFYFLRYEYAVCEKVLQWILLILHSQGASVQERSGYLLRLAKVYSRLGKDGQLEDALSTLTELAEPGKSD